MPQILDRPLPESQRENDAFQRRRVQPSHVDTIVEPSAYRSEDLDMRHLRAIGGLAILLAGAETALAQEVVNLKGTWTPTQGTYIVDGPSRHRESGTVPTPGAPDTHQTHTSKFVFRFEGQEGRKFWGVLSSGKVSEKVIGAVSVDGKRFVMADEDGTFSGTIVNADTLDYCYTHITPKDRAVACGLLVRDK